MIEAKYLPTKQSVTRALYQHDYGQMIAFIGEEWPETLEIHFNNVGDEDTIVKFGNPSGVRIPDEVLEDGRNIDVWVFTHETQDDGETVYHILIPVVERPNVADTPEGQDVEYIFDGRDSSHT